MTIQPSSQETFVFNFTLNFYEAMQQHEHEISKDYMCEQMCSYYYIGLLSRKDSDILKHGDSQTMSSLLKSILSFYVVRDEEYTIEEIVNKTLKWTYLDWEQILDIVDNYRLSDQAQLDTCRSILKERGHVYVSYGRAIMCSANPLE